MSMRATDGGGNQRGDKGDDSQKQHLWAFEANYVGCVFEKTNMSQTLKQQTLQKPLKNVVLGDVVWRCEETGPYKF